MPSSRNLGTQLRAVTAQLDGDVQSLYDELGIAFRPRFTPIVQHLARNGPTRVNGLASEIGVSQPAATQTVAEMTRLGLVAAAPGADGRERLIGLTDHGAALAERLEPLWRAVEGAARDLNAELPMPLAELLAATLHALHREGFKDRVRRRLEED
jgi:DNA-binding MarR family transcriptional regulator